MRQTLHDWCPPALLRQLSRVRRRFRRGRDLYPSYEAALSESRGYEEDDLVDLMFEKTVRFRASLQHERRASRPIEIDASNQRLLIALHAARRDDRLNVLDFGGSCGHSAFLARVMLPEDIEIRWHIVETTAMVERARRIAEPGLRFFTSIQDAADAFDDEIDLTLASSALQHTPHPTDHLEGLTQVGARRLFITRAGMSDEPELDHELVTILKSRRRFNGPGPVPPGFQDGPTSFPMTITPRATFERIIRKRYDLLWRCREQRRVYVFDRYEIDLWGLMARRREETAAGTISDGRERSHASFNRAA